MDEQMDEQTGERTDCVRFIHIQMRTLYDRERKGEYVWASQFGDYDGIKAHCWFIRYAICMYGSWIEKNFWNLIKFSKSIMNSDWKI